MTLHPIIALENVIREYRDYLRTEFRARDPELRAALEEALDRPNFLAQEPFFQAHKPFRKGKRWRDLPIDPKLAAVMEERARRHGARDPEFAYSHQSEAIDILLSPEPSPVVVTTGTGSGKTEAFLLPVLQNAIEDASRFKQPGLTAILIYPMNALANDQLDRIREFLKDSGLSGIVEAEKYDRGTRQADRERLRRRPPHILLTNYMMLEYLLVRPSDREGIFANHRCRFLVLDEVHTYRGALGANVALLTRRLRAHLARARQDRETNMPETDRGKRFPGLIPVGTSATIKSVAGEEAGVEEALRVRDEAVRGFFSRLTGSERESIRVLGEELEQTPMPASAEIPSVPPEMRVDPKKLFDAEYLRQCLCKLAGGLADASLAGAARRCRLLWDLSRWLVHAPMSLSDLTLKMREETPEREDAPDDSIRLEIEAGLVLGAALPDGIPGALRLRVHRFVRGGWSFHRCLNPSCGRLFPMGEERCRCGYWTAPLYLCRNCGADYPRLAGGPAGDDLRPGGPRVEGLEWMLYEPGRFEGQAAARGEDDEIDDGMDEDADEAPRGRSAALQQMKGREVLRGHFDPEGLAFTSEPSPGTYRATLAPARTRCLCCLGRAGSRNVVTAVSLGTSAALKVISEGLVEALHEANEETEGHDGKERLLVFSDSRQDASHQARFILFASRYDRMRRRLVRILEEAGPLSLEGAVERLAEVGVRERDNPHAPKDADVWIGEDERRRIRAWEEAPLLDEVAVNAGYRATAVNLGLVGIFYGEIEESLGDRMASMAEPLGVREQDLTHIVVCLLDEMRTRGALSREMLRYHPLQIACPEALRAAEWERRFPWPQGYALGDDGRPVGQMDLALAPRGVKANNPWRRPGRGGSRPSLERILRHLLSRFGGIEPDERDMVALLDVLLVGRLVVPQELLGWRDRIRLLQVNAERLRLKVISQEERLRCDVCHYPRGLVRPGSPCPRCHGNLRPWAETEIEANRYVRRIRSPHVIPLVAREHTAQVPHDKRSDVEEDFKAPPERSKVNLLACSPTLELGIDVGALDAVALRNIPPRPDNYAQRGGRAGRRSRVGLVVGYTWRRPHDQYFFDRPSEMIAGEVACPAIALGNRDVVKRHLSAIVLGAADPGLAGRMVEYVSPEGELQAEAVEALKAAVIEKSDEALDVATQAFGDGVLSEAGLDEEALRKELRRLPDRIQDVFDRTVRQVLELRQALEAYAKDLIGRRAGTRAAELVRRLLGLRSERARGKEADDRSAGYPLRRFAEFGILPGYEFPSEPAALRLLGDEHEEESIYVARQFGIAQYQPGAHVFARSRRWAVIGLDTASPWNPQSEGPTWTYRVCRGCRLRYRSRAPRCPRCGDDRPTPSVPAWEFGGFLARREERAVLDEEDRVPMANRVRIHAQWDGEVVGRWRVGEGASLRLSRGEEVRWLNEGTAPTPKDFKDGVRILHQEAKGYLLCASCGRMLRPPETGDGPKRGRRKPQTGDKDAYGHGKDCAQAGSPPEPLAIAAAARTEVLRLLLPVRADRESADVESWGLSLGYTLRIGMRRLFMLDGPEIEFEMEGPWEASGEGDRPAMLALTFIDPSLGGTGYLRRAAEGLSLVAAQALEHLRDHEQACDFACYRCLKTYANQRFHDKLKWPLAHPALEAMASIEPASAPLKKGDLDDPRPWLAAYAAGVGSPLELAFLRLFEKHGFRPEKQAPISPTEGGRPITLADFAVPERRLAIYVDGASIHVGSNLRRDRFIRRRLREADPPWQVEELRSSHLREGEALVRRLQG